MDQAFFNRFYKEKYTDLAASFDRRGNIHRYVTRIQQVSLLVSSAITPVLVALSDIAQLKNIAIALASLVAVLSGLGQICRPEDAWMNSRATRNALWREGTYFQAELSDYATCPDKQALFIERVTMIIERYNLSQSARIQESFKDPVMPVRKPPEGNA